METVNDLFYVKRGKGAYREELELGEIPLVSATITNNGIIDHVDIEPTFKAPAITVERVTGNAFVQLYDFATTPDDIAVLLPRTKMSLAKLFYIASEINLTKWRFNYSRKAIPPRIKEIPIDLSNFVDKKMNLALRLPKSISKTKITHNNQYKIFKITELFKIDRGDFHALDALDEGTIPTVSRIDNDNGITGYYEKPDDAELYPRGLITISTVTGDVFVQIEEFIATDNVLILKPKKKFQTTTLFFIQLILNMQKWRFSYGRQPYKRIFSQTQIRLPVKNDCDLDEDYMEKIVKNCYGWNVIQGLLQTN